MKHIFHRILESVDNRLPQYFLIKGGRLQVAPLSLDEYNNLINNGYEPLLDVSYNELDKEVLEALNAIVDKLGNRAVLLYPLAVSAIISHEAKTPDTPLYKALNKPNKEQREIKEVKRRKKPNPDNEQ
jgi:hypothetical protein